MAKKHKKRKKRIRRQERDWWLERKEAEEKHRYIMFDNRNFRVMWQKIIYLDESFNKIKDHYDHQMKTKEIALRIEYGA